MLHTNQSENKQFLRNGPRSEKDDRNQIAQTDLVRKRNQIAQTDLGQNVIAGLHRILHHHEKVLSDLCIALAEATADQIPSVISSGVCDQLVRLLSHASPSIYVPALSTIGNIVAVGDTNQAQVIIDHGVLPCLRKFLVEDFARDVKKEAVWIVSNLLTGTEQQIQCVIAANLIGPVVDLLQHAEFDVQEESAWAISNASFHGAPEQIKYLASQGCIKPLCDLLISPKNDTILVCLEALENILQVGETERNVGERNFFLQMIDGAGGCVKIANLQNHEKAVISVKAMEVLNTYVVGDDAAPSCSGSGGSDLAVLSGGLKHSI